MKKAVFLTCLFLKTILPFSFSQFAPPCPVPPPPGAESCPATCVYCNFDGYMGINNGTPSGGNTVCGAISLHNDQWFGFIAGSTEITIDISTWNCNMGNGLQAAFFDACGADALTCNPGTAGGEGGSLILSYSGFVPGQTYYLMVDGWANDVCNYQIGVINGSVTPPPVEPVQPMTGCTQVCPGATCVYSVPPATGAGTYLWTAPPGSSINGGGNSMNITAVQTPKHNLSHNLRLFSLNFCGKDREFFPKIKPCKTPPSRRQASTI